VDPDRNRERGTVPVVDEDGYIIDVLSSEDGSSEVEGDVQTGVLVPELRRGDWAGDAGGGAQVGLELVFLTLEPRRWRMAGAQGR
jgi:hypothetical protein